YGTGVNVYLVPKGKFSGFRSPFALKKVNEYGKISRMESRIEWEARLLRKLSHPNIVGFRGKFRDGHVFQCDSSLMDVLEKRDVDDLGPLPALSVLMLSYEAAKGLAYLHSQLILHGDIKSDNVLVDKDLTSAKLCDLGTSLLMNEKMEAIGPEAEYIGSLPWSPPEALEQRLKSKKDVTITDRADIYAFGMLIYEMCTLSVPHANEDTTLEVSSTDISNHSDTLAEERFYERLGKRPPLFEGQLDDTYNQALEIFHVCSEQVSSDRPSAQEIVELLRDCLPYTPDD
ncbi:unnamed protein product, partial [Protopolystoma xenopodis]